MGRHYQAIREESRLSPESRHEADAEKGKSMSDKDKKETIPSKDDEFYSISVENAQREYVQIRRANQWVPFFVKQLQPGMEVLDCGCGVGSITIDLGEIVAPGQVIGIDQDPNQLKVARALAKERGVTNVQFQVGNAYELEFSDESFDAVLAHTLLVHLSDPLVVLVEMHRVLKPTGVIGVSDDDYSTLVISPQNPILEKFKDLWPRYLIHNGGNPYYSRHLRSLLLQAGFSRTEGHAVAADSYGSLEETRRLSNILRQLFRAPEFVKVVTDQKWTSEGELEAMIAAFEAWGERPDAFAAIMYCAAVGWV
jgi:ubiquinone/menaquinone biosynthesis C-methylase UbiE